MQARQTSRTAGGRRAGGSPVLPPASRLQLVLLGTHHRAAPVEVRERLAFDAAYLLEALRSLRGYVDQGFILSTCNRVEIYGVVPAEPAGEARPALEGVPSIAEARAADRQPHHPGPSPLHAPLLRFLGDWHQSPLEHVTPHLYAYAGAEAVRHLFRLAAGLDSMVLGEDQIVGQLKAAFALARQAGLSGRLLNRLQHSALAAGKLVRARTDLSRSHLSVVSVALDLARASLGGLGTRQVLVVGAGRIAELALKHLQGSDCRVAVANRTFERACTLAERYRARPWSFEHLAEALRQAEVVVSCTAAPEVVLGVELVAEALRGRAAPLLLLDLAVPRDVDPRVAELPGVRLLDVDDLQAVSEANRAARAAEVERAEALVQAEVERFMAWWAAQRVVPTIRALRARAEAIREAELRRTLARLPDLSPRQRESIHALSAAIVNKLLHAPIVSLKDPAAGDHLAQVVEQLFQLSDSPDRTTAAASGVGGPR